MLDVAVREFGLKGLHGASTRDIATAAGTAMSSITYYFGGKEGLYLAVADHIAECLAVDRIVPAATTENHCDGACDALHQILDNFASKIAGEAGEAWAMFMLREQMSPTAAFDRICAGPLGRTLENIVKLLCLTAGFHNNRPAARIAAITLIGQIIALRAERNSIFRLMESQEGDATVLSALQCRIRSNLDAVGRFEKPLEIGGVT